MMIIKERIKKTDGSIRFRNYLKQQKLGKGGFAECFEVERMQDKKHFALKIIDKKNLEKPKAKQKMISEINLHKSVKHKNICTLERVFEDDQNVYMLLELCSSGNMFELIRKRKRLTIQETQYYMYQLIGALCHLHNHQLIHRDIKLGNLLINSQMELKLADFGLATKLQFPGDKKHTVCGTPNYIAPEVILSSMGLGLSGHSYQVDIWSSGVIMYLMLIGRAPFQTSRLQKTYEKISKANFDFPQYFREHSAKDLLRKILVVDTSKRYTFEQILSHEFMNPKNGIPKQIPTSSLLTAPKFESKFEKYSSIQVKESARNVSINTLRSEVDMSVSSFDGLSGFHKREENSKDIKGLLKTVFSTSSLSKSLKKLDAIGRTSSPISRTVNGLHIGHSTVSSRQKISLRDRAVTYSQTIPHVRQVHSNQINHVYLLDFKKEIVLSYLLNTGYVGTYEPKYKLVYNKKQGIYFEAEGQGELKRIKYQTLFNHDNVQNRKKYMRFFIQNPLECQPFINTARVVYLKKAFEVKSENIILFKLSNGNIQMHQYNTDKHLVISGDDIIFVTVNNGREVTKQVENKENYHQSKNRQLISLYLKYKKINAQMTTKK